MPRRAAAQIRPVEADSDPSLETGPAGHQQGDARRQEVHRRADRLRRAGAARRAQRDKDPIETLEAAIKALTPTLEVKSRRVGGATYQVPVEVASRRARTLAVRWLVEFARQRREKTMAQRLANELSDAQSQQGGAYKRKDDIYRMAQANKAFAHYRW